MRSPSQIDELNPVAVGVFDKRDMGAAVRHRSRLADNLGGPAVQVIASFVNVFDAKGQVAECIAEIVFEGFPSVSQFDDGVAGFVAVADKRQGEFTLCCAAASSQNIAVELNRFVQIVHSNHRM